MTTAARESLAGKLPFTLPQPCPICGAKVILSGVTCWTDDGEILEPEYECETEPEIDSDEWQDWFEGHFTMPYVDWLPWQVAMLRWLNGRYFYRDHD